jgi:hypothetical protein
MSKRYAVFHGNRGDLQFPPSRLSNGCRDLFARGEGDCDVKLDLLPGERGTVPPLRVRLLSIVF